ncbi:hypothetical protein BC938DRAFT_475277 [Jimgerdemannia flammicorona]|uniref:SHSP domain-containing protein n=1 Tax=Jimgerdemannia flammicorona TaxID=994334 RepID=A0A433QRT2_9FUNG|nr:hypothetical protein BC938DRAFT_475277 [Jimgerdemannia flammicorona]
MTSLNPLDPPSYESGGNYRINVDVPGVRKEDVRIDVSSEGNLVIQGHRRRETNLSDTKIGERSYGRFKRT